MDKRELRAALRQKAGALSGAYIAEAGERMTALVTAFPAYLESRALFAYVSTAREPDTSGILDHAWRSGKAVYVPKCLGKGVMKAIKIESRADLSPGLMGILEPAEGLPEAAPGELGFAVVPCVSVTKAGLRLGHGGGYYDRFFEENRLTKLCLCFEKLLSGTVPTDAHDVRMDYVATETEIVRCGGI